MPNTVLHPVDRLAEIAGLLRVLEMSIETACSEAQDERDGLLALVGVNGAKVAETAQQAR